MFNRKYIFWCELIFIWVFLDFSVFFKVGVGCGGCCRGYLFYINMFGLKIVNFELIELLIYKLYI